MEEKKHKINRNPLAAKPVFANDLHISFDVKYNQKDKEAEVFARFQFLDPQGFIISESVVPFSTAKNLAEVMPKNLENIKNKINELLEKGIPRKENKKGPDINYIS